MTDDDIDRDDWLTVAEAMSLTKLPRRSLGAEVRRTNVESYKDSTGLVRYEPSGIESLVPPPAGTVDVASAFKEFAFAAKNSALHAEKLLALVTVPSERLLDKLSCELAAARARIVYLEERMDSAVSAREALLSQQADRDIQAQAAKSAHDRKERIVRIAETRLPQVIDRFLGGAKAATAMRLLDSLDPAVYEALLSSGILTPAQAEMLKELTPESPVTHAPQAAE